MNPAIRPAIRPASQPALAPRPMRVCAPTHRLAGARAADGPDHAGIGTREHPPTDRAADRAAQWALVAMEAPAAQSADDFARCGWFDSSLDLAAGLQVIEHLDTLPDGLPLLQGA